VETTPPFLEVAKKGTDEKQVEVTGSERLNCQKVPDMGPSLILVRRLPGLRRLTQTILDERVRPLEDARRVQRGAMTLDEWKARHYDIREKPGRPRNSPVTTSGKTRGHEKNV
jgi:hypothetical protein